METKERILVKAGEMFMRYGIRSVSMDDIAAQLGMSKKTIYQFFGDKDELVDAVMEVEIGRMQEDCSMCSFSARDAVDEIFLTMEQIQDQMQNMNQMVVYDLEKFHHKTYIKFREHKDNYLYKIIADNLVRGMNEGLYRPELNINIIARFRLESMMMAFNIDLFPTKKFSLVEVTSELIEHYVFGLATNKGHKLIEKYKLELQKKLSAHAK
ncbi:MAG: TetR/AcrR family transcriptional regulator [Chitinophagaceae bacterium]|nr:TetR/AcrR family transcriptional regulator [Chitinophagaceae bacterium]